MRMLSGYSLVMNKRMHRNREIRQPLAQYWLSHVDSQFSYRDTNVHVEQYLNMLINFYTFFGPNRFELSVRTTVHV